MTMVASLFSIFDPFTRFPLASNWFALFSLIGLCGYNLQVGGSALQAGVDSSFLLLKKELGFSLGRASAMSTFCLGLFFCILSYNGLGLTLYTFTPTSHLAITFVLALSIWAGLISFSLKEKPLSFFSHLLPTGTPVALMFFMVLIESVSVLIRPLTLAVRLMANMVAGHLLLSLAGGSFSTLSSFLPLVVSQSCLVILELAVAVIQAYVFMVLVTLYIQEA